MKIRTPKNKTNVQDLQVLSLILQANHQLAKIIVKMKILMKIVMMRLMKVAVMILNQAVLIQIVNLTLQPIHLTVVKQKLRKIY